MSGSATTTCSVSSSGVSCGSPIPRSSGSGHERAAEWFVAHGQSSRAIDHHLDAGQLDAAFDLVTTQLAEQLGSGRHETVRSWLARFPDEFVDATPEHQLLLTLAHGRSGGLEVGRRVIQRARTTASPEVLAEVGVHYDVTDAAMNSIQGDPETAIALGIAAWERKDEVDLARMRPGMATAVRELWGYLPVGAGEGVRPARRPCRRPPMGDRDAPPGPAPAQRPRRARSVPKSWAEARNGPASGRRPNWPTRPWRSAPSTAAAPGGR